MGLALEELSTNTPEPQKSEQAFRTIAEVAAELKLEAHVLRFWETKFSKIKPLKLRGGRRYYRPQDVEVIKKIRDLLYDRGYTIRGVQKLISSKGGFDFAFDSEQANNNEPQINPTNVAVTTTVFVQKEAANESAPPVAEAPVMNGPSEEEIETRIQQAVAAAVEPLREEYDSKFQTSKNLLTDAANKLKQFEEKSSKLESELRQYREIAQDLSGIKDLLKRKKS